jgi:hypothetical protein
MRKNSLQLRWEDSGVPSTSISSKLSALIMLPTELDLSFSCWWRGTSQSDTARRDEKAIGEPKAHDSLCSFACLVAAGCPNSSCDSRSREGRMKNEPDDSCIGSVMCDLWPTQNGILARY